LGEGLGDGRGAVGRGGGGTVVGTKTNVCVGDGLSEGFGFGLGFGEGLGDGDGDGEGDGEGDANEALLIATEWIRFGAIPRRIAATSMSVPRP
jgi:hypothetical protein